ATALSMVVLAGLVPFIALQQWMAGQRSFTTVSGKYTNRLYDLGALRWPLFGLVVGLLLFIIVLPVCFMVLGTFMKVFGQFNLPDPWTMNNWRRTLTDPQIVKGLVNTLLIAGGATIFSLVTFTLLAYVSVRSRAIGRLVL